jgi:papain like protease
MAKDSAGKDARTKDTRAGDSKSRGSKNRNSKTKGTGSEHAHRILNCVPSRDTEQDWRAEHAVSAGMVAAPGAIPAATDLRADWWTIGDQGATGSCVGWACADSVLRWHLVNSGRLGQDEMLSVRFQWMAAKETDEYRTRPTTFIEEEGTSLKTALDVARRFGVVTDAVLPFSEGTLFPGDAKAFYAIAAKRRIAAYFNLGADPPAWRQWLATSGPILTRLGVDQTWDNATDTNGNLDEYLPQTVRGGHAVALVGYTRNRFIVRNSWGLSWGDHGYAYASPAYASAAFTEAYGVSV